MGDINDVRLGQQNVLQKNPGTSEQPNKTGSHRNRRRVRPKKNKKSKEHVNNCSENNKLEFRGLVISIMNPNCGYVVRKKEDNAAKIDNIYQYTDGRNNSYVFDTTLACIPHAQPLDQLLVVPSTSRTNSQQSQIVNNHEPCSSSHTPRYDHQLQRHRDVQSRPKPHREQPAQNHKASRTTGNYHQKQQYKNGAISKTNNGRQNSPMNNSKNHVKKTKPEDDKFESYISEKEAIAGIKNGLLVQGVIRINPKFSKEAYCSQTDRNLPDYCIRSVADRNRALEGDIVALKILPKSEWRDNQKMAKVVYILQKVHARVAAGHLSVLHHGNCKTSIFIPRDKRMPRMNIQELSLPDGFMKEPARYEKTIFMARMLEWIVPNYGVGIIVENVGKDNDIKAETRAILLENSIDFKPFPAEALRDLPKTYKISDEEIKKRLDLRGECIFTIDPLTARDLDDAVSIKLLPNHNYEVGVHIADVTFYLREGTLLDNLVAAKATSTYLVDNVYHMLPPELCMACSLLPGRDALAFSVIWEMTDFGFIVNTKFARTVINSCTQLAYEHAQSMIDLPRQSFEGVQLPPIHGNYKPEFIRECVLHLNGLARMMRRRRFDNGALRIDQIKLGFRIDPTGNPEAFFRQETRESNRLIEEFMLQANISVAEKIYAAFPDLAFLRRHEKPNSRLLKDVKNTLEVIGMHLDVSTSAQLHESIEKFRTDDFLGVSRLVALNHLLARPMTRAKYFCSAEVIATDFHHYALSVPIYTHFTSPIRRYPDVMVHRLLAAALGYREKPKWRVNYLCKIAENCNTMKYNAKLAGEASSDLMLAKYVETHQPFIAEAVVVNVFDKSFDVIVLKTGSVVRVHLAGLPERVKVQVEGFGPDKKVFKIVIIYPEEKHQPSCMSIIDIFQIVRVSLTKHPKTYRLDATLIRPVPITINPDMLARLRL